MKHINELKDAPYNPRSISKEDFESLKNSIEHFGDLSGVVFNRKTGNLVGGHQRIQAFRSLKATTIISEQVPKNGVGTVAVGYIDLNGERYAYREVEWDERTERMANIAANKIQGDWDEQKLAEVLYELQNEGPVQLTGFSAEEIDQLMAKFSPSDIELPDPFADKERKPITCPHCGEEFTLGGER